MKERIQKILSKKGVCSRRKAETLLREKRIHVNGNIAFIGEKAHLKNDTIKIDNQLISKDISYKVILINKPLGIICSCKDTHGRKTVLDLLPNVFRKGLYPIGRLDKDSRGALLVSNNGLLCLKLSHPKYKHEKSYEVWISGSPSNKSISRWRNGVYVNEQLTKPAIVDILKREQGKTLLKIVLIEGRNRQIRKVAAESGRKVIDLNRVAIATIKLVSLKSVHGES